MRTVHAKVTWSEVHTFLSVFGTPKNLRPRYSFVLLIVDFFNRLLHSLFDLHKRALITRVNPLENIFNALG